MEMEKEKDEKEEEKEKIHEAESKIITNLNIAQQNKAGNKENVMDINQFINKGNIHFPRLF